MVGIRDSSLSAKLQMDSELTLEKANRLVRQQKAVRGQQAIPSKPDGESTIQTLHCGSCTNDLLIVEAFALQPVDLSQLIVVRNAPTVVKDLIQNNPAQPRRWPAINAKKGSLQLSLSQQSSWYLFWRARQWQWWLFGHHPWDKRHIMDCPYQNEIVFKLDTGAKATAMSVKTFRTLSNVKPWNQPRFCVDQTISYWKSLAKQLFNSHTMGKPPNRLSMR